jgi:hypothetical protein
LISKGILRHFELLDAVADNAVIGRLYEQKPWKLDSCACAVGEYMAVDDGLFRCSGGNGDLASRGLALRKTRWNHRQHCEHEKNRRPALPPLYRS